MSTPTPEILPDMVGFIRAVMQPWPESCRDAGDLQELAAKHGILIPETRHEFCDDDEDDCGACPCREVCDSADLKRGFECYRMVDLPTNPLTPADAAKIREALEDMSTRTQKLLMSWRNSPRSVEAEIILVCERVKSLLALLEKAAGGK